MYSQFSVELVFRSTMQELAAKKKKAGASLTHVWIRWKDALSFVLCKYKDIKSKGLADKKGKRGSWPTILFADTVEWKAFCVTEFPKQYVRDKFSF